MRDAALLLPPAAAPAVVAQPTQAVTSAYGPEMEKYVRMRRSGLPDGAIANAMSRDGVTPPPGFLPDDAQPLPPARVVVAHATTSTSTKPAGGSLVDALAGFDKNKLKHSASRGDDDNGADERPKSTGSGGGLVDALAGFDRAKLKPAAERTPEEKKELAAKGQAGFGAVFEQAIGARRKFIADASDDDADDDNDEWAM